MRWGFVHTTVHQQRIGGYFLMVLYLLQQLYWLVWRRRQFAFVTSDAAFVEVVRRERRVDDSHEGRARRDLEACNLHTRRHPSPSFAFPSSCAKGKGPTRPRRGRGIHVSPQ